MTTYTCPTCRAGLVHYDPVPRSGSGVERFISRTPREHLTHSCSACYPPLAAVRVRARTPHLRVALATA